MEAMKHTASKMALWLPGFLLTPADKLPPMERPGVQEMLAAVHEGRVGAVMMPSLRHLSRELGAILLCWPNF